MRENMCDGDRQDRRGVHEGGWMGAEGGANERGGGVRIST